MGLPLGSTARDLLRVTRRNPVTETAPLEVHLVPHTHWDREWYHVAPRFRQRLVALVDALLDEPNSAFLLDGQAIVLRDYLAVRPEAQNALAAALRAGAIESGPWFVLADNLIPSGEAIVRNLEAGRRVMSFLGAESPPVAYCPDTFGHPAAIPMIASGFGLSVAVVWRGAGGVRHPATDTWWWQAPDGSRVLTHHLPPDGYEFGSALPTGEAGSAERWTRLSALYAQRNRAGVALLLNGADHHARQRSLPAAVRALRHAAGGSARIQSSSLTAWAHALWDAARSLDWPVVHGELRDSYGYTWSLGGTYATRAHQKRRNARLERGLLRDVEPWLALARLHRGAAAAHVRDDAQLSMAQLPALLHRAWEDLLATHPHDTLCGCSTDAVARSMDAQQELVAEQGKELRDAALRVVLQHDAVAARDAFDFDWRRIVLRNRAPRPRGGLAIVRLEETLAHAPVGPGSTPPAVAPPVVPTPVVQTPVVPTPVAQASAPRASAVLPFSTPTLSQPLSSRLTFSRRESPQHYPDNDLVRQHRVLLWVPPVPPFGVDAWNAERWAHAAPPPPLALSVQRLANQITMANGRITLRVDTGGQEPAVVLVVDDRELRGVLAIESQRDEGDTYTPSLRGVVESLRCVGVQLVAEGPLRATVRLWWRAANASRKAGSRGRVQLTTDLIVDAMSPVLQCEVRGRNHRTDHRLQLVWRTDVEGARVWADAAFGPVPRPPIVAPPYTSETVPDTMPMQRWVMHANPMFGATMIADGLAEASATDGRLALTLLRAVGQLSRSDVPERPGHAGWPSPTPGAQSIGAFEARSALYLHGPMSDDLLSRVRDVCDDVLLPLVGETWRDLSWAGTCSGPALVGEACEMSAITVSHTDSAAIVLRVVNSTERRAWGTIRMPVAGPWSFTRCRLDETALAPETLADRDFSFEAGPREVLTLRVKRHEASG
jgi:mannosylglycerate hydrolase